MTSLDHKLTNLHVIIAFNHLLSLLYFSMQSNLIYTQLTISTRVRDSCGCTGAIGLSAKAFTSFGSYRCVFTLGSCLPSCGSRSRCQVYSLWCVFLQPNMRNLSYMGRHQSSHPLLTCSLVMVYRKDLQVKDLCEIFYKEFHSIHVNVCMFIYKLHLIWARIIYYCL